MEPNSEPDLKTLRSRPERSRVECLTDRATQVPSIVLNSRTGKNSQMSIKKGLDECVARHPCHGKSHSSEDWKDPQHTQLSEKAKVQKNRACRTLPICAEIKKAANIKIHIYLLYLH